MRRRRDTTGAVRNIWQEKATRKRNWHGYGLTREKLGQLLREFKERGRIDLQGLQLPDVVKRDIQEIEAFARRQRDDPRKRRRLTSSEKPSPGSYPI